MVFENLFVQIGVILAFAAVAGGIATLLRQPLIVAFIAVGILVGPSVFSMVEMSSEIELFARLGIALLLFVVGLKLDLHIIRTVGPVALASGLGQVIFTSAVGYLIALAMGMSHVAAIYVAVALTFSSTIIIVKLLSDKREVDSLHGRIAVGFLIVQDIVVVLVMIGLTAFGEGGEDFHLGMEAATIILKGAGLLIAVALLIRYILPPIMYRLSQSTELLMLFSIAWAVMGAIAGDALGFSKEVGAFLAGVTIASTQYREQVAARLVSLRDFLLLFFFIELGANLDLSLLGGQIWPALIFSVFVLVGNPIIVMLIMGFMGYRKRTGFLAGLTVAQISEFSLILAALGFSLGHLSKETVGLITLVGLITISVSTYMILYSHQLYEKLAPWLDVFERKVPFREDATSLGKDEQFDVLLIGLGRYGTAIASRLRKQGYRLVVVDFDPELVRQHEEEGFTVHYGDAEDPEFIATLPLSRAQWIVSTVRDRSVNQSLLYGLRDLKFEGKIAIASSHQWIAEQFAQTGVDLTLVPYTDAAEDAVRRLIALTPQEAAREF